jgi:hypothetical protein
MNDVTRRGWRKIGFAILLLAGFCLPRAAKAATEETFPMLQIGTRMYTNVTITTKAKNYIFLMHSTGMLNVKVSELPTELLHQLGYKTPEEIQIEKRNQPTLANAVAKLPGVGLSGVKSIGDTVLKSVPDANGKAAYVRTHLALFAVIGAAFHMFFSFCGMMICQKTGNKPGILVWIPVLQLFPLLKAAGMSYGWFLAFLVPVVNIFALIVWAFKVTEARRLASWIAVLVLLPGINILGLLCLAFAEGAPEPKKAAYTAPQLMTLETA